MRTRTCVVSILVALALAFAQRSEARNDVFGYVTIWDVAPDQVQGFETRLLQSGQEMARDNGFINERLLRNIDPLTYHYATYTKSSDRATLEAHMRRRMDDLRQYLRRDPETHLARITFSYFRNGGGKDQPNGREFGVQKTGQIAHLGLFIPYPEFRAEYERTLHRVKVLSRDRKPRGYIGEDVLVENDLVDPAVQTPYTPRALKPAKMSINYGEYETLENAEDSYIRRGGDRPTDPAYLALERIFYSALQVPTRFYLFRVIGNVNGGTRQAAVAAQTRAGK
ncbi:MAG: hypothetical protein WAM82_20685 [Thermoanaerobaculia bacterium]